MCVASYQSVNKDFPAFYTRKSGSRAPYNFLSALEAAEVINSHLQLGLHSGLLIAVPVPEQYAMDGMESILNDKIFYNFNRMNKKYFFFFSETEINVAIENALKTAKFNGVRGKEITPFLLSRISEITEGRSLQTSILFQS